MRADHHIARNDSEPELSEDAYQFACDHVAAELESEADTAQLVATLSGARHVMSHLSGQAIPSHLAPYFRELADLISSMSDRVDAEMRAYNQGEYEEAA
ncbi:MAG: hypothetical protein ACREPD_05465 [Stenotrophomonas sp.]|uniref:hypothetical protein n=1 Tax=Stenotrophomonas sp. TaxID=69392 RepID=UPI003D6D9FBF